MAYVLGTSPTAFTFHVWQGPPYLLTAARLLTETRPGLNEVRTWNVGTYGVPFDVQVATFYDTFANAVAAISTLQAMRAAAGKVLTVDGTEVAGYRFKVLDVIDPRAIAGRGTYLGNGTDYQARVTARLNLRADAT